MGQQLIDLTHPFDAETIYWPTEEGFKLIPESAGVTDEGYYYAGKRNSFGCGEGDSKSLPRRVSVTFVGGSFAGNS